LAGRRDPLEIRSGSEGWQALTRYIDNGDLPADNKWVDNQIRPTAIRALQPAVRRLAAR
jgi:hypothetical protein